jgi:hypothetical protein
VSSTFYDDPNRQSVGLEPIWTGADAEVEPTGYDPGDDTVDDVKAYVDANPDQRAAVLKAEKAGKNRTTLVDWLQGG